MTVAVTGASGQLGRFVLAELLKNIPADQIIAVVRQPEKIADLEKLGVHVRQADYNNAATLNKAFAGVDKLLLISSSEVGQRERQHRAAIAAAKQAEVALLAYTSLLHADRSPLSLAIEHRATEKALQESGIPFVLLRNGWYTENYAASIAPALQHGAFIGAAGSGRIASAPRADYAKAAAAALQLPDQAGKVYELAGDEAYTLAEFTAEIGRQAGKKIDYVNLPEEEFAKALTEAGLPGELAKILADSDAVAGKDGLFDDSRTLSQLIGQPTTPYAEVIRVALAQLSA